MSSKDKKTQKELINDLTILVNSLTERIDTLEGRISLGAPWKQRPWPTTKNCPHCNGTGKVEGSDWEPQHPYYNNSF